LSYSLTLPQLIHHLYRQSFFFTHPPPPHIYTLSLHDALPISPSMPPIWAHPPNRNAVFRRMISKCSSSEISTSPDFDISEEEHLDRKSTRLNSSHSQISYAVFCLKKKKKKNN